MKKYLPILALLVLAVVVLVALGLGWSKENHPSPSTVPATARSAPSAPTTPYGAITSIAGDMLTLRMQTPFSPQAFAYTVELATSSIIVEHLNKTPKTFAAEQKAYKESGATTPPIAYTVRPLTVSDLKVGWTVEAPGAVKEGAVWDASELIVDSTQPTEASIATSTATP